MYSTPLSIGLALTSISWKATARQYKFRNCLGNTEFQVVCLFILCLYNSNIFTETLLMNRALTGLHMPKVYPDNWLEFWPGSLVTFLTSYALSFRLHQHLGFSSRQGTRFSCFWTLLWTCSTEWVWVWSRGEGGFEDWRDGIADVELDWWHSVEYTGSFHWVRKGATKRSACISETWALCPL